MILACAVVVLALELRSQRRSQEQIRDDTELLVDPPSTAISCFVNSETRSK